MSITCQPRLTRLTLCASKLWLSLMLVTGCNIQVAPARQTPTPPTRIKLIPFEATTQEIAFPGDDGTQLAGQMDSPPGLAHPPLIFIIHHSGAVDRDSYQYLAARLVPTGYAVFRFDKRGTGKSRGVYGCCEDDDALAAYRAAIEQGSYDPRRVYIIAQSIGSQILASRFKEFRQIHQPTGVILLSNLLQNQEVLAIESPLHIIVSDSEPNLEAISQSAVNAHRMVYGYGASYYVAPRTEHTLFDLSDGPMDWSNPNWPDRFHEGTWFSLLNWLQSH